MDTSLGQCTLAAITATVVSNKDVEGLETSAGCELHIISKIWRQMNVQQRLLCLLFLVTGLHSELDFLIMLGGVTKGNYIR